MPKNRIIITLGAIIALLLALGFPRFWESFFQVAAGLSIILTSVWAVIDKRISIRAKAQKRQIHKNRMAEMEAQTEVEKPNLEQEHL